MIQIQARIVLNDKGEVDVQIDKLRREDTSKGEGLLGNYFETCMIEAVKYAADYMGVEHEIEYVKRKRKKP